MKRLLTILVVLMLSVSLVACGKTASDGGPEDNMYADGAVIQVKEKEITKTFTVEILDKDQNLTTVTVKTDLKTVGEALQQADLLYGEQGEYGLYIKTVNGITADYEKDGMYWAFYIDGEYAMTGVDMTESADGAVYRFAVEK